MADRELTVREEVEQAIDRGGGQTVDIYGVIRKLTAMSEDARNWFAAWLIHGDYPFDPRGSLEMDAGHSTDAGAAQRMVNLYPEPKNGPFLDLVKPQDSTDTGRG